MASRTDSSSSSSLLQQPSSVSTKGALAHRVASRNRDAFLDEVASQMGDAFLSGSITSTSLGFSRTSSWPHETLTELPSLFPRYHLGSSSLDPLLVSLLGGHHLFFLPQYLVLFMFLD